jgi:glycosyltransferase involved in cell wall biosynthesis
MKGPLQDNPSHAGNPLYLYKILEMKVTLINTSDSGGGAAAAGYRLFKALRTNGVDARLLVQHRSCADEQVRAVVNTRTDKLRAKVNFFAERLPFIAYERDPSVRFAFSTANTGVSIAGDPFVKDADILHLHWTNGGFLSIRNLRELFSLGKPIVWTLHDMWAFTGGCHYSEGCERFSDHCGNCPFLKKPYPDDLSGSGWLRKQELYQLADKLVIVTCSNWLKETAKRSSLLAPFRIEAIPNPIDTELYAPGNKAASRSKWKIGTEEKVILFGAANITHKRKGIAYLAAALNKLKENYPDTGNLRVIIFGKNTGFDIAGIPFRTTALPLIRSRLELVELYTAADVFVQPSLEDNLPNMVMESLACGTPVAAFHTGGLPDLIDHKVNGYLAELRSADDLAAGIYWLLGAGSAALPARNKVLENFNGANIAGAYGKIYNDLLT